VRRVKRLQYLDIVEDLPQGVRAGSSQKDSRSREQVQGEYPFEFTEEEVQGSFYWKSEGKHRRLVREQVDESR
jgi:hypothetical protein